jgi:hypothetical protein
VAETEASRTTRTESTTTSTTVATTVPAPLPPHEREALAEIFDEVVEPLGYRVTRAALITRESYAVDPEGDHLAIYLAPLDDISFEQFASDLPAIAGVFLPHVFDRWPGLVSFDVCQEPFASDAATPPSLTIIDITREAAALVDWAAIDLEGLIDLGESTDGIVVWARPAVRDSTAWQAAING